MPTHRQSPDKGTEPKFSAHEWHRRAVLLSSVDRCLNEMNDLSTEWSTAAINYALPATSSANVCSKLLRMVETARLCEWSFCGDSGIGADRTPLTTACQCLRSRHMRVAVELGGARRMFSAASVCLSVCLSAR